MKKYKYSELSLILLLCFSCIFFVFIFFDYNNYKTIMNILLLYYTMCLLFSFSLGVFNLYQIFLLTTLYFLLGRAFLDMFGICDIRLSTLVLTQKLSDSLMIQTFKIILVFLIGISCGFVIIKLYKNKDAIFWYNQKCSSPFIRYYKILFYIYTILSFIKMLIFIKLCMQYGYKDAIFGGIIDKYHYPIFLIGVNTISFFLYLLVIFYDRSTKNFIICSGLTAFIAFTNMFTGQRGPAMLKMVMIVWIWGTFYKKLGIKFIFGGTIGLVFVTQFFLWFRRFFIGVVSHNRFNPLIQSLYDTAVSIYVIPFFLKYKETMTNKVPFFLGYFLDLFKDLGSGQTIKRITNGNYLGDHLTYVMNPDVFLSNGSSGTSIYAEAIDIASNNLFILFIFSFILMIIIYIVYCQMYRSFPIFIIAYFTISRFFYSPRDSVGKILKDILLPLMMALFVCFLELCSKQKTKKYLL